MSLSDLSLQNYKIGLGLVQNKTRESGGVHNHHQNGARIQIPSCAQARHNPAEWLRLFHYKKPRHGNIKLTKQLIVFEAVHFAVLCSYEKFDQNHSEDIVHFTVH